MHKSVVFYLLFLVYKNFIFYPVYLDILLISESGIIFLLRLSINEEKIAEEALYDGYYSIVTSEKELSFFHCCNISVLFKYPSFEFCVGPADTLSIYISVIVFLIGCIGTGK